MQVNYNKLITFSYNIVGSYDDAKDLVQDVIEKYITVDKTRIKNESNFLIKSVINHSINFKKRQNKKEIFGEWLPEPVSFDTDTKIIQDFTASYTMLVLLEKLNPKERAVFILKEGFDYSHIEIAEILDLSYNNCRQLHSRAKRSLKQLNFKSVPQTIIHKQTLKLYQQALSSGDVKEIEKLLVNDIQLKADGGKKVQVVKAFEIGKKNAATLLNYVQQQFLLNKKYTFHNLNHQQCICFWDNGKLYNCQILNITDEGEIADIYSIVDPIKLKNLMFLSQD